MAKKTKKSTFDSRVSKVRKETRYKEAEAPGGGGLPPGVRGIAKLTQIDMSPMDRGKYEGERRCYIQGRVVTPKTFTDDQGNEHKTEGELVHAFNKPLCDTEFNSFDEQWEKTENALKLIGIPTEEIDDEDLIDTCEEYPEEEEVYFKYRTWKPEDGDRVLTVLLGLASDEEVEQALDEEDDEVEDKTEEKKPKSKKSKSTKSKKKEEEPEEEAEEEEDEEIDFKKLGRAADKGDEDAQEKLSEEAEERELDYEDIDKWKDVAQLIMDHDAGEGEEDEEGEEEEDEEPEPPEKGEVYGYKPPRAKKVKECKVTRVAKTKGTCSLSCLDDGKTYSSVPWTQLVELE